MKKEYEFKGRTVEAAIDIGLKELDLDLGDVDVKVVSEGGFLKKAVVVLTPIDQEAELPEPTREAEVVEEKEVVVEAEQVEEDDDLPPTYDKLNEDKQASGERRRNDRRPDRRGDRREDRRPREKKEYFVEERKIGKEYLEEIAKYFSKSARIDTKATEDEICFYIGGEDAKKFIGHRGETLDAIQTLVSQIVNDSREEKQHVRVMVDADFYRVRRKRVLTGLARKVAAEAYDNKREISLEPMNSYERRIIHGALQNSDYATTRSEGEGKDRHVVIVPKCEVISYGNVSSDFKRKGPKKTKTYGGKKVVF